MRDVDALDKETWNLGTMGCAYIKINFLYTCTACVRVMHVSLHSAYSASDKASDLINPAWALHVCYLC